VFSCRTKLEKLLCLKWRGSRSLLNSGGFQTMKLQHHSSTRGRVSSDQASAQCNAAATQQQLLAWLTAPCSRPHLRPSGAQDTIESVSLSSTKSYLQATRTIELRNWLVQLLSCKAGRRSSTHDSYVLVRNGGGWLALLSLADAPLVRDEDPPVINKAGQAP
jgi:hypothetical protein